MNSEIPLSLWMKFCLLKIESCLNWQEVKVKNTVNIKGRLQTDKSDSRRHQRHSRYKVVREITYF